MTSKEALSQLKDINTLWTSNRQAIECNFYCSLIEKDLDALEFLKSVIMLKKDKYGDYSLYLAVDPDSVDSVLTPEEYNLLKNIFDELGGN